MNRRTSWTVSSSWPTPRWDSVSHCSGIRTPVGRGQGGDREHTERGRAVQQDPVVVDLLDELLERRPEDVLAARSG